MFDPRPKGPLQSHDIRVGNRHAGRLIWTNKRCQIKLNHKYDLFSQHVSVIIFNSIKMLSLLMSYCVFKMMPVLAP